MGHWLSSVVLRILATGSDDGQLASDLLEIAKHHDGHVPHGSTSLNPYLGPSSSTTSRPGRCFTSSIARQAAEFLICSSLSCRGGKLPKGDAMGVFFCSTLQAHTFRVCEACKDLLMTHVEFPEARCRASPQPFRRLTCRKTQRHGLQSGHLLCRGMLMHKFGFGTSESSAVHRHERTL